MQIDGAKRREIRLALLEAFPTRGQLRMLAEETFDEPLENITAADDLPTAVFDLISWAKSRGRLTDLVIAAAAENPRSPKLRAVAEQFKFAEAAPGELERIVQPSALRFENVAEWLQRLSAFKQTVCRIEPRPGPGHSGGHGTGFLVAPDVVLTCYHVVEPFLAAGADGVVVRFGYEAGAAAEVWRQGEELKLAPGGWGLALSGEDELDFALIRLASRPAGLPAGDLPRLEDHAFAPDEPLLILQHPQAAPLKLSFGSVVSPDDGKQRVTYSINTLVGSSGSPCLSSALKVVALHEGAAGTGASRGVRAGAILRRLESEGLAHLLGGASGG